MTINAWQLPWHGRDVPHCLVDILRGCDITCRACYNSAAPRIKPVSQIEQELNYVRSCRNLDSVSIVGGEPTLHPDLLSIIRMIKSKGLSVELFTNGLNLTPSRLADLKNAGTDLIFLHIDPHQRRPDLVNNSAESLITLRKGKAQAVAAAGIEAGLAITAYRDSVNDISDAARFVLESPHYEYLLVTLCRDVQKMGALHGELVSGMQRQTAHSAASTPELTNTDVLHLLHDHMGLSPFAYIGSNVDADDPRWLSYMIASVTDHNGKSRWSAMRATAIERLFLKIFRKLKGRYPFYMRQAPNKLRMQLILNALTGGRMLANFRLFLQSFGKGKFLHAKRLLIQAPAELRADGHIIHCNECPDATVRNGRLVPVCISDQITDLTVSA